MKTSFKIKIALYFLGLIMLSTCSLMAQEAMCDCKQDLKFLIKKVKKTPAYKNDYRQDEKVFDSQVEPILERASSQMPLFDCYNLLVQTLQLVNDGHNTVYGNNAFNAEMLKDENKLEAFKETAFYTMYPKFSGDLNELYDALSKKPNQSIEGVYYAGSSLQIGVVADSLSDAYKMLVLKSQLPIWKEGEQLGVLKMKENNQVLGLLGNYTTKTPVAISTGFKNGELMSLNLAKDTTQTSFWRSGFPDKTYHFEHINPNLSYIKIGSFSGFYPVLGEAEAFYKELEGQTISGNVILDLRDNGGGGNRNSDILLKILEGLSEDIKIYVLINQSTASNAEQFTIRLRELDRVTVLGDRTKGMIAYELKDDVSILPSTYFKVYLTSKRHKEYLPYEGVGVTPDVYLDYSKDWLQQTRLILEEEVK